MKVRTLTVIKRSGSRPILGISKMDSLPTHSDRNAVCLSFAHHIYLVCGWSNVFGQILPSYWLDTRACVRFVELWLVSRCTELWLSNIRTFWCLLWNYSFGLRSKRNL